MSLCRNFSVCLSAAAAADVSFSTHIVLNNVNLACRPCHGFSSFLKTAKISNGDSRFGHRPIVFFGPLWRSPEVFVGGGIYQGNGIKIFESVS